MGGEPLVSTKPRILVVGAGPAGVRATAALVAAGIRPTVIDEGRVSGGQIYRRQPDNFSRPYEQLYGSEATKARGIHGAFDGLLDRIDYLPDTLVWNIVGNTAWLVSGNRQWQFDFDALIICSGATDRLMPVKGWNQAGCYSLGGAQIALKAQACAIGRQVVFLGSGPLLYLVASQYLKAGAGVAAVLDTSPLANRVKALPDLLARPGVLWQGMALTSYLIKARVPVYTGVTPLEIDGDGECGVTRIHFKTWLGLKKSVECDAVAMGWHLRPETQLADLAQCRFAFDIPTRQWLAEIDDDGRATVPGIYLAGDGARVLGADAAELSGELAARAALQDLGMSDQSAAMARLRKRLKPLRRFAQGLATAFPWPVHLAKALADDTVVCRCEVIRAGELREILAVTGSREANRAKAFSRVGMGRCQGRYCANAAAEVICAATGTSIESAGRLRGQAPVKPLPISVDAIAVQEYEP